MIVLGWSARVRSVRFAPRRMALSALVIAVVLVPASVASAGTPTGRAPDVAIGRLLKTLSDPGATSGDGFGEVSLAASTAVIGAYGTDSDAGAAYIYTKGSSGWPTAPTVTLDDPGGHADSDFGVSVSNSSSAAVVSAPGANAVYIYDKGTSGWPTTPTATLEAPAAAIDAEFGDAVAISGSTAVIGAPLTGEFTGTAYIYTKGATGWPKKPTVTLDDPGALAESSFGYSVAVSGSSVFVGAPVTGGNEGITYVYVKGSSGWPTTPSVTLDDPLASVDDEFGYSVAVAGTTAFIGATGTNSDVGAVYVYSKGAAGWQATPAATLSGSEPDGYFGSSVALSGSTAVVGAFEVGVDTGAAYIYKKGTSGWPATPAASLSDPGATERDFFGESVALSGSTALVGAGGTDSSTGATYIYQA
jgi:hypothetical protein